MVSPPFLELTNKPDITLSLFFNEQYKYMGILKYYEECKDTRTFLSFHI